MTGTMAELWVAGLVLLATHFGIASTAVRDALIGAVGEGPYRGIFSLVAAIVIVWLVIAYNAAPYEPLWDLHPFANWLAIVVMPIALVLLIGGLTQPNPTAIGGERALDPASGPAVIGVQRITRHPVMWAFALWALVHLLANGDLASVVFFGSFALLALGGTLALDAKNALRPGYADYRRVTSNPPFVAVATGRQSFGAAVWEVGWWRLGLAVLIYAVLLHGHPWLFGVPPWPV